MRIINGSIKKGSQMLTTFCPTLTISRQVFQVPFEVNPMKNQLYYGLFGTSKTFSWILYSELSKIVTKAVFKGLIGKTYAVPKLIYFTYNPENFQ